MDAPQQPASARFRWLPGTFLYVNTGRELGHLDSPSGILTPSVLVSFALLGVLPLLFRKIVDWSRRRA